MNHEFKPDDKAMIEVEIIRKDCESYLVKIGDGCARYFSHDDLHPIPTPPRPLRVDELVKGERYEFDDENGERTTGIFHMIMKGYVAIFEVDDTRNPCYSVWESDNIRPVERVVTKEETFAYYYETLKDIDNVSDAIFETVRHFMKGGEK